MNKINSKECLIAAYNECKGKLVLRETSAHDIKSVKKERLCCGGTGCHASNSKELMERLTANIKKAGLENDVKVVQTGCFGFCAQGYSLGQIVSPQGKSAVRFFRFCEGGVAGDPISYLQGGVRCFQQYRKAHRLAIRFGDFRYIPRRVGGGIHLFEYGGCHRLLRIGELLYAAADMDIGVQ